MSDQMRTHGWVSRIIAREVVGEAALWEASEQQRLPLRVEVTQHSNEPLSLLELWV